jgi:hypothetical protein
MRPRKIYIIPPSPPAQEPPRKITREEIDRAMRQLERDSQALKTFRKKPNTK